MEQSKQLAEADALREAVSAKGLLSKFCEQLGRPDALDSVPEESDDVSYGGSSGECVTSRNVSRRRNAASRNVLSRLRDASRRPPRCPRRMRPPWECHVPRNHVTTTLQRDVVQ